MNIEEIFDKVEARLNDGNGRAVVNHVQTIHGDAACTYRNEDGNRCAIGIFLPDNREMLTTIGTVITLINKFKNYSDFPKFIKDNATLMIELQYVHDHKKHWDGNTFNERGQAVFNEIKERYLNEINERYPNGT